MDGQSRVSPTEVDALARTVSAELVGRASVERRLSLTRSAVGRAIESRDLLIAISVDGRQLFRVSDVEALARLLRG